jgi:HEAT repeat protein
MDRSVVEAQEREMREEVMSNREDVDRKDPKVADAGTISSLIVALGSREAARRQSARETLVGIGKPAVAPLTEALTDSSPNLRWEAAKTLTEIGDPVAAPALVHALEDEESAVRWLAAKGLIAMGEAGLQPLLQALIEHSDSLWFREGAHHVLHTLVREDMALEATPVLDALEDIEPVVEAPVAAYHVLQALRKRTPE